MRGWRRARRVVQTLALLLFFALFVYTNAQRPGRFWADLFARLDPLLMISASLAGRVLLPGLVLAGLALLLALAFGRAWCGWLCPLGTVLEVLGPRANGKRAGGQRPEPPEGWRKVKYLLLIAILAAAALGNQTLVILDPITLLNRTLTSALWPAVRHMVAAVEGFLYQFQVLWPVLDPIHNNVVVHLFQPVRPAFALAPWLALAFAGLVALNWWVPRFWCRYLCPLGGMLGTVARVALLRRQVSPSCVECGRCGHPCPTGTIDPAQGHRSDPAECIVCLDCLVECPRESAGMAWQLPRWRAEPRWPYDPTRRQALTAIGAAAVGVALAGVEPIRRQQPAVLIRPPGALLTRFSALCVRCGACVRVCPTQGLQPSLLEGGVQNVMTPHLVPRLGACDYGCHACGQVCPSGAIPPLTLEEKRDVTIGLAWINRDRCLPWAYETPCIVCEEMCPVPDKAIHLEEVEAVDAYGQPIILQRPFVLKELCIGCGMCEFKCPMGGESAIRVTTPTEVSALWAAPGG